MNDNKIDLQEAIQAIRARKTDEAYRLLVRIVEQNPKHAQAWYLLSFLVKKEEYQIDCLHRALKFAPEHHDAKERLQKLTTSDTNPTTLLAEATEEKQLSGPPPEEAPVQPIPKYPDVTVKPSLDELIAQWFRILDYREQKVLEYIYLDKNNFSLGAVGRIVSETIQRVMDIRQRALEKLYQPNGYDIARPLIEWFFSYIQDRKSYTNTEIDAAFQSKWDIKTTTPLGVSRLLFAIKAQSDKSNKPIKTRKPQETVNDSLVVKDTAFRNAASPKIGRAHTVRPTRTETVLTEKKDSYETLQDNSTPLEELGLSTRVYNALYRGGVKTIGQLAALSDEKLQRIRSIGETAVTEILSCLNHYQTNHFLPQIAINSSNQLEQEVKGKRNELPMPDAVQPISALDLSRRAYNVLMRNNIKTVQKLATMSHEELLGLRNAGVKTIDEIQTSLNNFLEAEARVSQEAIVSETEGLSQEQLFDNRQAQNDNNALNFLALPSSIIATLVNIPLNKISIERLNLNEITNRGLARQDITTIGDLVKHSQSITKLDEIGEALSKYLIWLAQQNESVWLAEVEGEGISSLIQLELANITCETLVTQWLEVLSTEREKQVLLWRYGIENNPITLQEIGGQLAITRERVRQIEKKALRTLKTRYKGNGQKLLRSILNYLIHVFREYGGLLSESELETAITENDLVRVGNVRLVGFLILICEIDNRFQHLKRHRIFLLAEHLEDVTSLIVRIQAQLDELVKENIAPVSQQVLLDQFKQTNKYHEAGGVIKDSFLLACLRTNPNIEQLESGYIYARSSSKRLGAIIRALREIGQPAHYSVITEKANSFLASDEQFTERAIHARLGQHPDIFVWTRLRGTYGLKEWGLEQGLSYVDAIEKIFLEEGRPLTSEQVIARLPAYREHFDEGSVVITLGTHEKFKSLTNNTYGLSSWNRKATRLDFADMFGEQLVQRQADLDRHNNNAEIDTQSEVDKIRRIGLDFFAP